MSSDFYFRDKIPVAVLGATNELGQKLVHLLAHHPWFEVASLCDSMDWIGKPYSQAVPKSSSLPISIQEMQIQPCTIPFPCSLIFSVLDTQDAFAMEKQFAEAGYYIVSCAPYVLSSHIPLIVAEVNPDQLSHVNIQHDSKGGIVANPHPAVIGLTLALKPLMDAFGLDSVQAVVTQSRDNMRTLNDSSENSPLIFNRIENFEIEQQTLAVLGNLEEDSLQKSPFKLSVQGNYKHGIENDEIAVSIKFKRQVNIEEIRQVWRKFGGEGQRLQLPNAPYHIIYDMQSHDYMNSTLVQGMSIYLESISVCPTLEYKFSLFFSHLGRGMIGSMLLNAELLVTQGKIYW